MGDFSAAWTTAAPIPGWLTRDQAHALWNAATGVEAGGVIVEIGSHQGRSTIVIAQAASLVGARVVAIDPFVDGAMFGGSATRVRFEEHIAAAGVDEVVELIPDRSTRLRRDWTEPIGMLFVDGKHDYWTAADDLRWSVHLPTGAAVLVHDAFSSVGVTAAVLIHVLPSRRLRYVGRAGSLASFQVGSVTSRDRLRIVSQLPWFLRNVAVKVALRLLRLVGYRRPDPF